MLNKAIFVHVPKCGGTTITKHLLEMFPAHVCPDQTYRKYREKKVVCYPKELNEALPKFCYGEKRYIPKYVRVITGHFEADKWRCLGWPMFTMIRDPVERIISHYSIWWRRWQEVFDLDIREFADFTSNQMSLILGEDLGALSFIGMCEFYDESIKRIEDILGIKFPTPIGVYNKTHIKLKVGEEDREYIRKVNQEDIALYEMVRKGFR